MYSILNE